MTQGPTETEALTPSNPVIAQAVLNLISKKSETKKSKSKLPVDSLEALKIIKACKSPNAPSAVMIPLEGLMTSTVADESEWSTAWTKLLAYVLKHNQLPDTLQACDVEVAKKYAHMLKMKIADPLTDFAAATAAAIIKKGCRGGLGHPPSLTPKP